LHAKNPFFRAENFLLFLLFSLARKPVFPYFQSMANAITTKTENQKGQSMLDITTFLARKGQIVTIEFQRELKTRKTCVDVITKLVTMQARAGVSYDNMASVQEKRENGELPAENAGLPWGVWAKDNNGKSLFPHVIEHKGKLYFRFSAFSSNVQTVVKYFRNGVEVSKESVIADCLASEFAERESLDVFNVKAENILAIR
jgi:hypothetical protein